MESFIDPTELDTERLLADWSWLIGGPVALVAVSTFGELLLRKPDGTIWFLNIHGGTFDQVAPSTSELERRMDVDSDFRDSLLKSSALKELVAKGCKVGMGQCFTYKLPIVLGNAQPEICTMGIYEAVGFLGDVHRQIKDLPDGSKISLVVKDHQ